MGTLGLNSLIQLGTYGVSCLGLFHAKQFNWEKTMGSVFYCWQNWQNLPSLSPRTFKTVLRYVRLVMLRDWASNQDVRGSYLISNMNSVEGLKQTTLSASAFHCNIIRAPIQNGCKDYKRSCMWRAWNMQKYYKSMQLLLILSIGRGQKYVLFWSNGILHTAEMILFCFTKAYLNNSLYDSSSHQYVCMYVCSSYLCMQYILCKMKNHISIF